MALTAFMISRDGDSQSPEESSVQLETPSSTNTAQFTASGLLPGSSPEPFSAGLLSPLEPGSASSRGAPPAGKGALRTPPANCDTSFSSLYCIYEVQEGDTLSTIADLFGLESTEDVLNYEWLVNSNKPDITSADDFFEPGQKIRVPLYNGVIHTVLSAETLADIADQYGVSVEAIMAFPANGVTDTNAIGIGTEILVPNPARLPSTDVPDSARSTNEWEQSSSR